MNTPQLLCGHDGTAVAQHRWCDEHSLIADATFLHLPLNPVGIEAAFSVLFAAKQNASGQCTA